MVNEKKVEIRNRLLNNRCYMIGPMDRVHDGGIEWRKELTPWLENLGIIVLDPTNKKAECEVKEDGNTRLEIQQLKDEGRFDEIRPKYKNVRNVDLRYCSVSDFVIARVDIDVHMCGSYEEITQCNRSKLPVLIWCVGGKQRCPNWLLFMLPHQHIFGSLEELQEYLLHINSDEEIDLLGRWQFLNL